MSEQPLPIALPRSDWLLVEQALLIAAVKAEIRDQQSDKPRLWIDLLGMIGRARAAATPEHEAEILERRRLRDAGRKR